MSTSSIISLAVDFVVIVLSLISGIYSSFVIGNDLQTIMSIVIVGLAMIAVLGTVLCECIGHIDEYLKSKSK